MVRRLLPTAGEVKADAADALGVALCHAAHGSFRRRAGA
jgi:crossover junction endodeoxyribonuclease RuvC